MQENGKLNSTLDYKVATKTDRFQYHDYYNIDELLSEDHLLAREAVRAWVKKEVSPIIEDCSERAVCPTHLYAVLAEIGASGPSLTAVDGGGGMVEIANGGIVQELERWCLVWRRGGGGAVCMKERRCYSCEIWSVVTWGFVLRRLCKAYWSCIPFISLAQKGSAASICQNWRLAGLLVALG